MGTFELCPVGRLKWGVGEPLRDLTAACIHCGFCLESCPTFTLTGDESQSPRGRIHIVRALTEGGLEWSGQARAPLDTCLGCLACETACPSGVRYGEILELAREAFLARAPPRQARARRLFLDGLTNPTVLRAQLALAKLLPGRTMPRFVARMLADDPAVVRLPVARQCPPFPRATAKEHVALLAGCVMDVLFPHVHAATERLLARVGIGAVRTRGCCGALHAHAGHLDEGRKKAERVIGQAKGLKLVTNSAGCGSWLRKVAPPGSVLDATETLLGHGLEDELRNSQGLGGVCATYHDACHLVHGQRIREEPRRLLRAVPGLTLVDLHESETCCGSAGVYNLLQPKMAARLAERKWRRIAQTGADWVLAGNPGCLAWIESAKPQGSTTRTAHTLEALEWSFGGQA
jgi:glycolate oxidase iron-sulfur subunit